LFHKNVTRAGKDFDDRPFDNLEEMHSIVKDKWNAKVTNGDTVYILGDLAMRGTQEDLIAFVSTLKGHKVMVKGNHDVIKDLRYKQLFDEICDYKEISDTLDGKNVKLVLCHYPILMWKDQHRGSILLYGHVHNSIEEYYFKKCLRDMNNEDFFNRRDVEEVLRAYNVGCMMPYMDYEPRSLTEIATRYERFENSVS
jgi:calcineurin-like phosphoesterase family protein